MPAQRPTASFEPISPFLDLPALVEETPNFKYSDRVSYKLIEQSGPEMFEKLMLQHVIIGGQPLVIEGYDEKLDPWIFNPTWLADNEGSKVEMVRDLTQNVSTKMTIKHYLQHMGALTEQFFDRPDNFMDKTRQRSYLKDIDCPQVWRDKLKDIIPACLFYWNSSTGEIGGPGADNEGISHVSGRRKGRGVAPAGDLMSSLPLKMRAENLMCYVGHEGTYTPAHREMCATMGHNIMVHTSSDLDNNGVAERPGTSIWFMTEKKDRKTVAEYWQSTLGHDIEIEDHFAQLAAWQRAPFTVYIVEQRVGDFILIPPLAPHQVWNRGTRTMKVAWNRTTVETLDMALSEGLPNSRLVCRDEQYKNKAIIYFTLMKYHGLIVRAMSTKSEYDLAALYNSYKYKWLFRDFKRLFNLFKDIMLSEMFSSEIKDKCEFEPLDKDQSNVMCSYCRGNIFNRFLTCKSCNMLWGDEEPYDVCMDCYVMGRSCKCQSKLTWVEQFRWKDLVGRYMDWRALINSATRGNTADNPLSLEEERTMLNKKSLAHICQEQLRIRPWVDIKKPVVESDDEEEEVHMHDDDTVRKIVKRRPKNYDDKFKSCHTCLKRHEKWQMATCTRCNKYWCYGSLFRAYDMMPKDVMENSWWECPHCLKICATGKCRNDPRQKPHVPKGTLLGHDTKKVADVRSVEVLVDFSRSNLGWIRDNGVQLEQRQMEAMAAIETPFRDIDDPEDAHHPEIVYSPVNVIDPKLEGGDEAAPGTTAANGVPVDNAVPVGDNGFLAINTSQAYECEMTQSSYYPDPVDAIPDQYGPMVTVMHPLGVEESPVPGAKRHREFESIKLKQKKRKITAEQESINVKKKSAVKQFEAEQHKKQLDQARKDGRFVLVWAKMQKKSLVVKLPLSSETLQWFRENENAVHHQQQHERAGLLLQSGIAPCTPRNIAVDIVQPKITSYKTRVEEDGDFVARRGRPKKKVPKYEEISIDNKSDEEFLREAQANEKAQRASNRRRSEWLAKRRLLNQDENVLDQLPESFKDGSINRCRDRESVTRRETVKKALEKTKLDLTNEPDYTESKEGQPTLQAAIIMSASELARRAILETENARAKQEAERYANGEDSESDGEQITEGSLLAATTRPTPMTSTPTPNRPRPGSLAARMRGKKIKIVSAFSKKKATVIGKQGALPGKASV